MSLFSVFVHSRVYRHSRSLFRCTKPSDLPHIYSFPAHVVYTSSLCGVRTHEASKGCKKEAGAEVRRVEAPEALTVAFCSSFILLSVFLFLHLPIAAAASHYVLNTLTLAAARTEAAAASAAIQS